MDANTFTSYNSFQNVESVDFLISKKTNISDMWNILLIKLHRIDWIQ